MNFKVIFLTLLFFNLAFLQNICFAHNINNDPELYINDTEYVSLEKLIVLDNKTYISADDIHFIWGYGVNLDINNKILEINHKTNNDVHKFKTDKEAILNQDYNNMFIYDYDKIINESKLYDMQEFKLYADNTYIGNAYYHNDTFYIPFRAVAEKNKCSVYWDNALKKIDMKYNICDIYGKEADFAVQYQNNLGFDYLFIVFRDSLNNSRSILAVEYINDSFNDEAHNLREFLLDINPNEINSIKMIDLSEKQCKDLINNINEFINNDEKTKSPESTYACDFPCRIIYKNDDLKSAFFSYPQESTTVQYENLKSFLETVSEYKMEFNHLRLY